MKRTFAIAFAASLALTLSVVAAASRNVSGTYSLPAGNPVVSGTPITTTWANNTLNDISTELTNSLDRTGKGGMLAAVRTVDGTVTAPAYSFTNETGTGLYRIGASDLGLSLAGVKALEFTATTTTVSSALTVTGALTVSGAASVTGAVTVSSAIGNLVAVTTPSVGADLTSGAGSLAAGYWRDAVGVVHLRGTATTNAGGAETLFTLPVGSRPLATRSYATFATDGSGSAVVVSVASTGAVTFTGAAGKTYAFDVITFLAEQ